MGVPQLGVLEPESSTMLSPLLLAQLLGGAGALLELWRLCQPRLAEKGDEARGGRGPA